MATTIFWLSGTTLGGTFPGDYNSAVNQWHALGGGGGGQQGGTTGTTGGSGGGAEYRRQDNVSGLSSSSAIVIGGSGGAGAGSTPGSDGTNTSLTTVLIAVGGKGNATSTGGTGGTGTTANNDGGAGHTAAGANSGEGGGGAGGPTGVGQLGGDTGSSTGSPQGGAGGGAADGGSPGGNTSGTAAAAGGNNNVGSGGGTAGVTGSTGTVGGPGSAGGGGGGGGGSSGSGQPGAHGGVGGSETIWTQTSDSATAGPGGGGGGGGYTALGGSGDVGGAGAAGGNYGGGGGGGGVGGFGNGLGAAGAPGILVLIYTPAAGGLPPGENNLLGTHGFDPAPGQPDQWWRGAFANVLPQIYKAMPVQDIASARTGMFDPPPPVRPGQPERWKPFIDLPRIYAQMPVQDIASARTDLFDPPPRGRSPETQFPDISRFYLSAAVTINATFRNPVLTNFASPQHSPEFIFPNLQAILTPAAANPFVWYDFAQHPPPPVPAQGAQVSLNLPGIYAQTPIGETLNEVHPLAPRGNPESWQILNLSQIYAQQPVGETWIDPAHPIVRPGTPERWRPFFDLAWIYSLQPVGETQNEVHPAPFAGHAETQYLNLQTTTLAPSAANPFVYYDFSNHPGPLIPVPTVIAQLNLPQVYTATPVGETLNEVHPLAPRGTPESWPILNLSQVYAQQPVGDIWIDPAHPVIRPGTPEYWQTILANSLPEIYAQGPVSRYLPDDARPQRRPPVEPLLPYLLGTTLSVIVQAPFVYYDFSAHPSSFVPPQTVPGTKLPQIYAQAPIGETLNEVHPLAPRGNPEAWETALNNFLPEIYAQQPIGRQPVEIHPLAPRGNPEPWKAFYDLSVIYAQTPVGESLVEVHPLAPRGNPEPWKAFFDLSGIYAQTPVGEILLTFSATPVPRTPEWVPEYLQNTTLSIIQNPFVWYDFSNHPLPPLPVPNVAAQLNLPQIYKQQPVGNTQNEIHPAPFSGHPERWKVFIDLASIYAQVPVGEILNEIHAPTPRPPYDLTWIQFQQPTITFMPGVVEWPPGGPPPPPPQFIPGTSLPRIYSQTPVGTRQLSFDKPPTVRGNPELWETIFRNNLPGIYAQRPTSSFFDFRYHPAYAPPAENILFPDLALIYAPVITTTGIEWILRARRRHNR